MNQVVWHEHKVGKTLRQQQNGHRSCVIWFTGLSGAGKSSVAGELEFRLSTEFKAHTYLLDGDNVRTGLCRDLGFSEVERVENIRRIGELSKLFVDAGLITLSAFISPFEKDRRLVRDMFSEGEFIEVFVDTALEECERRDPKGMYVKARRGEIMNFTGIDSPYQAPSNPEIILKNDQQDIATSVQTLIDYLVANRYVSPTA